MYYQDNQLKWMCYTTQNNVPMGYVTSTQFNSKSKTWHITVFIWYNTGTCQATTSNIWNKLNRLGAAPSGQMHHLLCIISKCREFRCSLYVRVRSRKPDTCSNVHFFYSHHDMLKDESGEILLVLPKFMMSKHKTDSNYLN